MTERVKSSSDITNQVAITESTPKRSLINFSKVKSEELIKAAKKKNLNSIKESQIT